MRILKEIYARFKHWIFQKDKHCTEFCPTCEYFHICKYSFDVLVELDRNYEEVK